MEDQLEVRGLELLNRYQAGRRLNRRDRNFLDFYLRLRTLYELQHICFALRTSDEETEPPSHAGI